MWVIVVCASGGKNRHSKMVVLIYVVHQQQFPRRANEALVHCDCTPFIIFVLNLCLCPGSSIRGLTNAADRSHRHLNGALERSGQQTPFTYTYVPSFHAKGEINRWNVRRSANSTAVQATAHTSRSGTFLVQFPWMGFLALAGVKLDPVEVCTVTQMRTIHLGNFPIHTSVPLLYVRNGAGRRNLRLSFIRNQ